MRVCRPRWLKQWKDSGDAFESFANPQMTASTLGSIMQFSTWQLSMEDWQAMRHIVAAVDYAGQRMAIRFGAVLRPRSSDGCSP